jgi:hypothetical protein
LIGKTSISSQLIILVHLKIILLVILVNTDLLHSNNCTFMELKTATKCTADSIDVIKLINRASISSKQIILVHLKITITSKGVWV